LCEEYVEHEDFEKCEVLATAKVVKEYNLDSLKGPSEHWNRESGDCKAKYSKQRAGWKQEFKQSKQEVEKIKDKQPREQVSHCHVPDVLFPHFARAVSTEKAEDQFNCKYRQAYQFYDYDTCSSGVIYLVA
jgi:hypothetical protein